MPITSVRVSDGSRNQVLEYIKSQKPGNFKVIDVGGGIYSWCTDYIDALVDINEPDRDVGFKVFQGDINEAGVWLQILEHVKIHGKYDFCICTHTLEDIRNPLFVVRQMEKIAEAGYIAVPSKYKELARFEFGSQGHRGYIHHRWIFDVKANRLIGYPKLSIIEYITELDQVASLDNNLCDLNFYWRGDIDLEFCNGDYMGPNAQSVVNYMKRLIY